ncbi:hypothetical protein EIN_431860 [Entamoeba invadens IP1]|uniref:Uncharacterized protein n=1 Tax=Entamoeba invadens IP1 TaxID=370355 RepID=A0A0A1UFV9_ENTIV|nr:hypothetical protein EIN_431860 [Entamoeba invadens IP1]ELP93694.1 hypothetical protein EIN_431860 [Entamoeba invadens IP1]|eukprot:XP_004260465.1 hypothetical protein EIN_431860 [Entamoeba invadens IP1]
MPSKLEMVYLMNVSMHLLHKSNLYNFLQVSHKCLSSLQALKVNPIFGNEPSLQWFFKHFSPDTFDINYYVYDNIKAYIQPKQIRNVDLVPLYKTGKMDDNFIKSVFPKITRLVLFSLGDENEIAAYTDSVELDDVITYSKTADLVIQNSKYLTALYYLNIDLDYFVRFLQNYTDNGKEKYLKLPDIVIANNYKSDPIILDLHIISLLKQVEAMLPDNQRSKIYIIIDKQMDGEQTDKVFKKTMCIYTCCDTDKTLHTQNIRCENGELNITGSSNGISINDIIERAYANSIILNSRKTWQEVYGYCQNAYTKSSFQHTIYIKLDINTMK